MVAKIDNMIFYLLMLYALSLCISYNFTKYVLAFLVAGALIRHLLSPYQLKYDKGLVLAIIFFITTLIISSAFSPEVFTSFRKTLSMAMYFVPFFLAATCLQNKQQVLRLAIAMAVSVTVLDAMVIGETVQGHYRVKIFDFFYMVVAGYLVQAIPLFWVLGISREGDIPVYIKYLFVFIAFLSSLALFMNLTRGAWLAVIITLIVFCIISFLRRCPRQAIATMVFMAVVVLIAMQCSSVMEKARLRQTSATIQGENLYKKQSTGQSTEQSVTERYLIWRSACRMFQDHPIVGVGLGRFGEEYNTKYILPVAKETGHIHAHNVFLQFLAETGIVGFAGFLGLFSYILWTRLKEYWKCPNPWPLIGFLVSAAILLQGLTEYNYIHVSIARMYWFLLGLTYAAGKAGGAYAGAENQLERRLLP